MFITIISSSSSPDSAEPHCFLSGPYEKCPSPPDEGIRRGLGIWEDVIPTGCSPCTMPSRSYDRN